MGLAASQVRLLQLTCRKSDISRELQHLSLQKMSLTRDMQAVSREYQKALCSKSMKWSNNAGITYSDISYGTLMRPNAANMKSPILITDNDGRVAIDFKYKKYAEMISSDGSAGGNWSGDTRAKILAELTGISVNDINTATATSNAMDAAAVKYNDAHNELDKWLDKECKSGGAGTKYLTVDKLAENMGSYGSQDLAKLYKNNGEYSFSSTSNLESLINGIKTNMSKYFVDDEQYLGITDKTKFEKACDKTYQDYKTFLDAGDSGETAREMFGVSGSSGDWKVNIQKLFKNIIDNYTLGNGSYKDNDNDEKTIPLRDTTSSAWKSWYEELKTKKAAFDSASTEYQTATDTANQVMTADQETMLDYYDDLFIAIVDNGWFYDENLNDNDYLNQMFQNNAYCLTTITRNSCYDENLEKTNKNWDYEYDTTLASNFENIISVNDSDSVNVALAEYEHKKSIINEKESRIDVRMKNLETEQSAIKNMIDSIKNVEKENIDRTMNIFG